MVHRVKPFSQVNFVDNGFQSGALEFKSNHMSVADAKKAIDKIGFYNKFDHARVNGALKLIRNDVSNVQVGREYSPVLYIHFPYWTGQKGNRHVRGMGERIPDEVTKQNIEKAKRLFANALADEIDVQDYDDHVLRVWWD